MRNRVWHPAAEGVGLLLLASLTGAARGQDSLSVAPQLVLDLYGAGGASGSRVEVMVSPDGTRGVDLGSWTRIGAAAEVRFTRRWSVQGSLAYALVGWEATGMADPYGGHVNEGDRWELGTGLSWMLHRTPHSLFTASAGVRVFWGMDVRGQLQRDTLYNSYTFQTFRLNYKPGVDPVLGFAWRWRANASAPIAVLVGAGIEHYQAVFQDAEPGVSTTNVLEPLLPLTERRSGWAWMVRIGVSALID